MKKSLIAILLLVTNFFVAWGQDLSTDKQQLVAEFISNIKQQNKEALAAKVAFPLKRDAPIPPVKSKEEFIDRYNEIFDTSLTDMIISSKPDKDWTAMGWRGIMLGQGKVWLDDDGKLIAVNYQSTVEKRKKAALVKDDKKQLNWSVNKYVRPVYLLETKKHRIRIDDLGNDNYRYSSWRLEHQMNETPDLVIQGGKLIMEGTGGNHSYEFTNDGYLYECSFTLLGKDDNSPAVLTIYKNGKALTSQQATIIR
jgi:hypothetical protein